MNYSLSTNPVVRKMLRDRIINNLKLDLELVTNYMEKHKLSPPTWSTYMTAIKAIVGTDSSCPVCGSPMMIRGRGRWAYSVCSLFPVHSILKSDPPSGTLTRCRHDIYLMECDECCAEEAEKNFKLRDKEYAETRSKWKQL